MSGEKIKKLFAAAQNERLPAPSADFVAGVLRVIRQDPLTAEPKMFSFLDQLNLLFPRLAVASAMVILAGVAVDYGLSISSASDLGDGVTRISAQWLLTPAGF